jgi:chorismate synthase
MSLQAVKGVEVGLGFATARLPGSRVHDEIHFEQQKGFVRHSNNSGGTEGGMSTGEPLRLRVAFKPLSTLMRPLHSVDIRTKEPVEATIERSDVCAIPAAAVIAESVVAFVLAQAFVEKFGGDSLTEMKRNHEGYLQQIQQF